MIIFIAAISSGFSPAAGNHRSNEGTTRAWVACWSIYLGDHFLDVHLSDFRGARFSRRDSIQEIAILEFSSQCYCLCIFMCNLAPRLVIWVSKQTVPRMACEILSCQYKVLYLLEVTGPHRIWLGKTLCSRREIAV